MEIKAEPRSVFQQKVGLSDEEFEALVERGALEVLRPPGSEEEMVPQYALELLLRQGIAALLRERHTPNVEYAWAKKTAALLERHPEIEQLLADFLRYISDNAQAHHFAPRKWSLRIAVDGRHCSVVPTSRGIELSVTRESAKEAYLVKDRVDFGEALRWLRGRSEPWPLKGCPQKSTYGEEGQE